MPSVVCTLFENHYHYGLAGLVNSLYNKGYRGSVYAGYRGSLPQWTEAAQKCTSFDWSGSVTLSITKDLQIHFIPLDTDYHLTNYKAVFMLKLWNEVIEGADGLIYMDPDILIKCRWQFFEDWISRGVALVHENVSNDMPLTHPVRKGWEILLKEHGKSINHEVYSYINGGFCGVSKTNINFIQTWKDIINIGINKYGADPKKFSSFDRTYPFWSIDQDALNMTAMSTSCEISEIGPDGMDFIGGGWTMSHATGTPKPWRKQYILNALKGKGPAKTDEVFWHNMLKPAPIQLYSNFFIKRKMLSISVAKLIGRIYHKR